MRVDWGQFVLWELAVVALLLAGSHLLIWGVRGLSRRRSSILGTGAVLAAAFWGWMLTDAFYPF